jgi:dihydroxyacid dehydratase/phosphogluconate dehydratase
LAGGPIGKLVDGDIVEIVIDRVAGSGRVDLVGLADRDLTPDDAARVLAERPPHPGLRAHPALPDDTRLWAALQQASGGTWAGCVYDVDRIITVLDAGTKALSATLSPPRLVPDRRWQRPE